MLTLTCRPLVAWPMVLTIAAGAAAAPVFQDDFESFPWERWQGVRPNQTESSGWRVENGQLRRSGDSDVLFHAKIRPTKNLLVDTRLRVGPDGRRTFGVALRTEGDSYLLVRFYDQPRALEVLSYRDGDWQQRGDRSEPIPVVADRWLRLKAAAVEHMLFAKLWPEGDEEPDWQLSVEVDRLSPGGFALVAHDNTAVAFDWVAVSTDDSELIEAKRRLQAARKAKEAALAENLRLAVVALPQTAPQEVRAVQRIRLVPHANNDRHPISGRLVVTYNGEQLDRQLGAGDFELGGYEFDLPAPTGTTPVKIRFETKIKDLAADITLSPRADLTWQQYVRACLDTLLEFGRDNYGSVKSPLITAVLDADTLVAPRNPYPLDALVRLEGRLHRRGERGSNLWYDQALLKALYRMTDLTGHSRYGVAADDYIRHFLSHCNKFVNAQHTYLNGMPSWGTHVYWDCYEDRPAGDGDGNGPHEILVFRADWENMYRVAPERLRRVVDGIWLHHIVDKQSGLHNRHDDQQQGCDFAFSGSSFANAFAFMYAATGEAKYLEQAKTVARWHWNNRNQETGLTADCPGLPRRYDGNHCFTTVTGPHAMALLECYALTGDPFFRDAAFSYIKSYDHYAWDPGAETYFAMLKLDGTPLPDRQKGTGYGAYAPYGHVNVWRTTFYSYEFTLSAAQAAVQAYETSLRDGQPDPQLLTIARRWASVVERAMPAHTGRRWKEELEAAMPRAAQTSGAYAEDYGRAVSLFVHLYRATNESHYLTLAEQLARDAVEKLFHNGLFLGHPAKPYYETTNGVGLLLLGLLELDAPDEDLGGAY